ncbi:MAG: mechanosensitive ion channel domain-containing protein [Tsuneonella sp.]
MQVWRIIAAALLLLLAAPLAATLPSLPVPSASPSATPSAAASGAIADTNDAASDDRIRRRIAGIFAELPAFAQVHVAVNQGVVALTGTVPAQADIARAEGIASRVAGVATVDNALKRDVSVKSSKAVAGIGAQLDAFARMLPLIGLALAVGIAIALVGYLVARLSWLWQRLARNPFLGELIASAIRFVFVVAGMIAALKIVGATALLGAVLGGAGLIGVALGFAMRDTVENYLASLMLSLRQPFRANDHVLIDTHEGRVIRLTTRATVLMTMDGNHLRLPNAGVFKAVILNYTRNPQRRFEFIMQIDTKADPSGARQAGLDALAALDFVLANPAPTALIADMLYPNIALQFRGWVDQTRTDFNKARSGAIAAVKRALEASGFAIPDPVTHVEMLPDAASPEPRSEPAPAPPAECAADRDLSPEGSVTKMVEEERAATPEDKDLLDSSKPTE